MGGVHRSPGFPLANALASNFRKRYVLAWIGLLGIFCFLGRGAGTVLADEPGSIEGVIQSKGKDIADHRIMLIRFGPDQEIKRTPGKTDAQGHFRFANLDTGTAFKYIVGIRYEGQLYQSAAITLQSGQQRTDVRLEVGQAAQAAGANVSQPTVHIVTHLMFIAPKDDHLTVREVVNLRYTGSKPYTGTTAHAGHIPLSLYFPLPKGYYNLRDVQGLETEHIHSNASGLYYTAPLQPGDHRVIYTYTLPFRDRMKVIFTDRTLPTAVFDVFIDDAHLVAASDLQFAGRIAVPPHTFSRFRGTNLAARSRFWLQLTRRTVSTPLLRLGTYSFVLSLTLLGMAIPAYGMWKSRKRQHQAESIPPARLQELRATYRHLLQTIAHLDDRQEAGTMEEAEYRHQRQTYKQQLIELAAYLHHLQQHKEGAPQRRP